jgi:hypothetical protein
MLTDVSEVCAASIIMVVSGSLIVLLMEAARTSEMLVDIQLRKW